MAFTAAHRNIVEEVEENQCIVLLARVCAAQNIYCTLVDTGLRARSVKKNFRH